MMFLDRALSEEPKGLQETFSMWYSFMEEKIEFGHFVSILHTKSHCARVLLYCLKIARMAGLNDDETTVLCKASIFHDSRRHDDTRDVGHGARAAENFRRFSKKGLIPFDERVYLIMAYHDRDDELGKEKFREKGLAAAIPLYDIFKDADAIDRWRISPTALDVRYLRTDWGRSLVEYARNLVRETT
jgi:hypothetical protein